MLLNRPAIDGFDLLEPIAITTFDIGDTKSVLLALIRLKARRAHQLSALQVSLQPLRARAHRPETQAV